MDPLSWLPFGAGPRNCIGTRFAVLEIKTAIVGIVKHYVIHQCPETKVPLPINKVGFRGPSEGVFVRISKRSS